MKYLTRSFSHKIRLYVDVIFSLFEIAFTAWVAIYIFEIVEKYSKLPGDEKRWHEKETHINWVTTKYEKGRNSWT